MNIPAPLNGYLLTHADFEGSFKSAPLEVRDLVIEMCASMVLRDGTQPDGTTGSVRVNSDQLRDALAFIAKCA